MFSYLVVLVVGCSTGSWWSKRKQVAAAFAAGFASASAHATAQARAGHQVVVVGDAGNASRVRQSDGSSTVGGVPDDELSMLDLQSVLPVGKRRGLSEFDDDFDDDDYSDYGDSSSGGRRAGGFAGFRSAESYVAHSRGRGGLGFGRGRDRSAPDVSGDE